VGGPVSTGSSRLARKNDKGNNRAERRLHRAAGGAVWGSGARDKRGVVDTNSSWLLFETGFERMNILERNPLMQESVLFSNINT
jgi:hypothetical protein